MIETTSKMVNPPKALPGSRFWECCGFKLPSYIGKTCVYIVAKIKGHVDNLGMIYPMKTNFCLQSRAHWLSPFLVPSYDNINVHFDIFLSAIKEFGSTQAY